jgi:RNA polymerase sigma factor (TIGR02999 family)
MPPGLPAILGTVLPVVLVERNRGAKRLTCGLPDVRRTSMLGVPAAEGGTAVPSEVTGLLRRWSAGDEHARDQLIPLVYERLRELAHQRLRSAPGENSLNTTGLVHEAYIRLVDAPRLSLPDRAHFLALASEVMRNLLVDRARARTAAKRGGGQTPLELNETLLVADHELESVTELDEALSRLKSVSPRQALLLQHRYFGGLSLEETATAAGTSLATAKRDLRSARAWLALELRGAGLL